MLSIALLINNKISIILFIQIVINLMSVEHKIHLIIGYKSKWISHMIVRFFSILFADFHRIEINAFILWSFSVVRRTAWVQKPHNAIQWTIQITVAIGEFTALFLSFDQIQKKRWMFRRNGFVWYVSLVFFLNILTENIWVINDYKVWNVAHVYDIEIDCFCSLTAEKTDHRLKSFSLFCQLGAIDWGGNGPAEQLSKRHCCAFTLDSFKWFHFCFKHS